MKKWKILEKKDVSPSKWFPVFRHKVELGNGTIVDDYFISPLGNVAMILPITKKMEIVLVKQYKHATGEIFIELPAGFQEKGQTIEETAVNELEEETGIKTTTANLIPLGKVATAPSKFNLIIYGFLAKNLEFNSSQKTDETEEIEVIRAAPKKVLDMVMNDDIKVVDSIAFILQAYHKFPEIFK